MTLSDLAEIEDLITAGDYRAALLLIDGLDDIEIKLWKQGVVLERMGKIEEAEAAAKELDQIAQSIEFRIRAMITLAYASWRLQKDEQWKTAIQKGRTFLEQNPSLDEYHQFKGEFFYLNGIRHNMNNKYWDALDNFKQSLEHRQLAGEEGPISHSLNALGIINELLGRLNDALDYHIQSLKIKRKIGNTQDTYRSLINLGILYSRLGEFNEAMTVFQEGVELAEKIGIVDEINPFYRMMADILRKQGKYNQAREYLRRVEKSELEESSKLAITTSIFKIKLLTAEGNLQRAEEVIEQLNSQLYENKDLHDRISVDIVTAFYNLHHPRPLRKLIVQERLKELLPNIDIIQSEQQIEILVYLARSLVYEYQIEDDPEILMELLDITQRLENIAETNHMIIEQLETLELRAKIEHIRGNTTEAISYLEDAIEIAKEKGYTRRALKMRKETDLLRLPQTKNTKTDLIRELEVDHLLSRMITEETSNTSEILDEKPVVLMILNEGGSSLYDFTFPSITAITYGSLMGSFISAIHSFGDQVFEETSNRYNRIEHGGYSIIYGHIGLRMIVYVYRGNSYYATLRFDQLVTNLSMIDFITKPSKIYQKFKGSQAETITTVIKDNYRDLLEE